MKIHILNLPLLVVCAFFNVDGMENTKSVQSDSLKTTGAGENVKARPQRRNIPLAERGQYKELKDAFGDFWTLPSSTENGSNNEEIEYWRTVMMSLGVIGRIFKKQKCTEENVEDILNGVLPFIKELTGFEFHSVTYFLEWLDGFDEISGKEKHSKRYNLLRVFKGLINHINKYCISLTGDNQGIGGKIICGPASRGSKVSFGAPKHESRIKAEKASDKI